MTRHSARVETAPVSRGCQTRASDASLIGGLALSTLVFPQLLRYAVRNHLIEVRGHALEIRKEVQKMTSIDIEKGLAAHRTCA